MFSDGSCDIEVSDMTCRHESAAGIHDAAPDLASFPPAVVGRVVAECQEDRERCCKHCHDAERQVDQHVFEIMPLFRPLDDVHERRQSNDVAEETSRFSDDAAPPQVLSNDHC